MTGSILSRDPSYLADTSGEQMMHVEAAQMNKAKEHDSMMTQIAAELACGTSFMKHILGAIDRAGYEVRPKATPAEITTDELCKMLDARDKKLIDQAARKGAAMALRALKKWQAGEDWEHGVTLYDLAARIEAGEDVT